MSIDFDKIKADYPIAEVIGRIVKLTQNGPEYEGLCPFHHEKTPSFTVVPAKGFYHCFGCGAHGDVIDFIRETQGIDGKAAVELLTGDKQLTKAARQAKREIARAPERPMPEVIVPVPAKAPDIVAGQETPPIYNHKRDKTTTYRNPSKVYSYATAAGEIVAYVIRLDFEDGKKATPTVTWSTRPDGTEGYSLLRPPRPYLLYNLDQIAADPDRDILIVEGEKCAEAVAEVNPHYIGSATMGGTQGPRHTDLTPLEGREVVLWPDQDDPGDQWAGLMLERLKEQGVKPKRIRIVRRDARKAKGWDIADAVAEGMDKGRFLSHAREFIIEATQWRPGALDPDQPEPPEDGPPAGNEPPPYDDIPVDYDSGPQEPQQAPNIEDFEDPNPILRQNYFRVLGYNENHFFFMPFGSQQILELSGPALGKNAFLQLHPDVTWWTGNFPDKTWETATAAVIRACYSVGIFTGLEAVRGRGAWLDKGRTIIHNGTSVLVDGKPHHPRDVESKYIYQASSDLVFSDRDPLTNSEAHLLFEIMNDLSWREPLHGSLLAGWCVVAQVCGVLSWRPHIWLRGESGAGKSTVMGFIKKAVGDIAHNVDGNTTEAAIRQNIKLDARPVVFDEAEYKGKNAETMQGVLQLARSASSGGAIYKGGATGKSMKFIIRSAFCFASINTAVHDSADLNRITELYLIKNRRPDAKDHYESLVAVCDETLTPEYSNRMFARTARNLPALLKNIKTFTSAASIKFSNQRMADQIGPMLAGAYLLHTTGEITLEKAKDWIERHNVRDAIEDGTEITNQELLLEAITTTRHRWHNRRPREKTIGEMIAEAAGTDPDRAIDAEDCANELRTIGIKVDLSDPSDPRFQIANRCKPIADLLRGTPWENEWRSSLQNLPGAVAMGPQHFSPGLKSKRSISLPITCLTDE